MIRDRIIILALIFVIAVPYHSCISRLLVSYYFINFIINTVKLNIVHTMDIHNVILTINPRLLGIGSILLNVNIMYINVFMFIIYNIFLYS